MSKMKITKKLTLMEKKEQLSGKHLPWVLGVLMALLFALSLGVVTVTRAVDIRREMLGILRQEFAEVQDQVRDLQTRSYQDTGEMYADYYRAMYDQDDLAGMEHSFLAASTMETWDGEIFISSGNYLICTFSNSGTGEHITIPVTFLPENSADVGQILWAENPTVEPNYYEGGYFQLTGYWQGYSFVATEMENKVFSYETLSEIPEDAELETYVATGIHNLRPWNEMHRDYVTKTYGTGSYTTTDFLSAWREVDAIMQHPGHYHTLEQNETGDYYGGGLFSTEYLGNVYLDDTHDLCAGNGCRLKFMAKFSPIGLSVGEFWENGTLWAMVIIYLALGFFMVSLAASLRKKEIQHMTDELARQKKALEFARDAEISRREMTGAIAHELKTPIAVLSSYAEALQENIDAQKQERYLSVIREETARMDRMVLELLDLSRLEAGKYQLHRENFDLEELAREILRPLEGQVQEKELDIQWQIGETMVYGDRYRLGQVVENFLTNAIRHTPEKGKIVVRLGMNHETLSVENQGKHIPPEQLPKVWETFWQGDQSRNNRGSGLGLAICRSIMGLHGGSCRVENTASGVRFIANLTASGRSTAASSMPRETVIELEYSIAQEYTTIEQMFRRLSLLDGVNLRREIRAGNIKCGKNTVNGTQNRVRPGGVVEWQEFRITVVRDDRKKRQALIANQFQSFGRLSNFPNNAGSTYDL